MAYLFVPPFQTTLDSNASPVSGAVLNFYATGTTTPAAVYSDAALSVPLTNPISADSAGRYPAIYLDPTITYRCKVCDAGGTTIRDIDPLQLQNPLTSSAIATALGFTPAGSNTIAAATFKASVEALASGSSVQLVEGTTYSLSALVTVPAGVSIYMNGATIQAAGGFATKNLLTIAGNAKIIGPGTFDGTNVPAPTGAYTAGQYSGVGVYISGTQTGGRIEGVTFQNFPAGPILTNSASAPTGFIVKECNFLSNQTYTGGETNGLVHFHGVTNGRQIDCYASGYNWKGFYVANGDFNQIVRCHANGGNIGFASHYISGGSDNRLVDSSHTNLGFGFKVFNSTRPVVTHFASNGSNAGGSFEGCTQAVLDGLEVYNSTKCALYLDGLGGVTASSYLVEGVRSTRTTIGVDVNGSGIRINANSPAAIAGLTIRDCRLVNAFIGISSENGAVAMTDINVDDNQIVNAASYGILGYFGSGRAHGNKISLAAGANAGITLDGDKVSSGAALEVDDNEIDGATSHNIEIGGQGGKLNFAQVSVCRNSVTAGTRGLSYAGNASAADTVSKLVASDNMGSGMTAGFALDMTFNTTTSTVYQAQANTFTATGGAPVPDSLTNMTNVDVTGIFDYQGSPAGVLKARIGTIVRNLTGGAATTLYIKESGTGTAGWAAK